MSEQDDRPPPPPPPDDSDGEDGQDEAAPPPSEPLDEGQTDEGRPEDQADEGQTVEGQKPEAADNETADNETAPTPTEPIPEPEKPDPNVPENEEPEPTPESPPTDDIEETPQRPESGSAATDEQEETAPPLPSAIDERESGAPEAAEPDDARERPEYPEVVDRSGFVHANREFAFSGQSPEQVQDMRDQRAPLGTNPEQWDTCTRELNDALAAEGLDDADVRLKGSGAGFTSENPNKTFPQSEDDLAARVAEHHRDAPEEERNHHVEEAVARYRDAGFSDDGPKPAAPFFDSMYNLGATDEKSDYDMQLSSDTLADRFRQEEQNDPTTKWRSDHGGHFKHQHLERLAPALSGWASRWENTFGRDVTIATFDGNGPGDGLHPSDWILPTRTKEDEERAR